MESVAVALHSIVAQMAQNAMQVAKNAWYNIKLLELKNFLLIFAECQ
jgi:hypothetical protein